MSKKESAIINEIDKARLKLSIEHYIKYFIGKRTSEINKDEALNAIALAVREFAMDKMYETMARYNKVNSKRIYYLSIEYLIGRSLENNLHNLGLFNILKSIKLDGMPNITLQEIFDKLGANTIVASLRSVKDGIVEELIANDKTYEIS